MTAIEDPIGCPCGYWCERFDFHYFEHIDTDPTLSEDMPGHPDYDSIYMESLLELAQ